MEINVRIETFFCLLVINLLNGCYATDRIEPYRCHAVYLKTDAELSSLRGRIVLFAEQQRKIVDFAHGDSIVVYFREGREDALSMSLESPLPNRPAEFSVFVYKKDQQYYLKKIDDFIEKTLKPNFKTKACKDVPDFYPSVEYK